jgi:hypothetical protein
MILDTLAPQVPVPAGCSRVTPVSGVWRPCDGGWWAGIALVAAIGVFSGIGQFIPEGMIEFGDYASLIPALASLFATAVGTMISGWVNYLRMLRRERRETTSRESAETEPDFTLARVRRVGRSCRAETPTSGHVRPPRLRGLGCSQALP